MVRPSPTAEPGAVVDDGEREFLLDGRDIAIGRAPSCDIVLAGDQLASRRHALLRLRGESYTVVDLGSSNGTYVNDEEIHAETPLNDGDRVTVMANTGNGSVEKVVLFHSEDEAHEIELEVDAILLQLGFKTALGPLKDWGLENIYDIYPRWQHRYAPAPSFL